MSQKSSNIDGYNCEIAKNRHGQNIKKKKLCSRNYKKKTLGQKADQKSQKVC